MKHLPAVAFVSLGSNLDNREKYLERALARLAGNPRLELVKTSPLYETAPLHLRRQPRYLNCVVMLRTDLAPAALLRFFKGVEKSLGRKPGRRYGPRVLDLDVLFYNQQVIEKADLRIPHPRLQERRFVLQPLCDINPEWRHPKLKKSIRQLREELGEEQEVVYLKPLLALPKPARRIRVKVERGGRKAGPCSAA